jgi:hypothetical protein
MVTITKKSPTSVKKYRNGSFWISIALFVVAVLLSLGTAYRWFDIRFRVGNYFITHWLAIIGTSFTMAYTPFYYVVKRRRPLWIKKLIATHMFGNLISFTFISMHNAQQLTRPAQFPPDFGTGVALYIVMLTLVITGFLHRFKIIPSLVPHQNRFLHISVTSAFYIVIIVHILQGIRLL